MIHINAFHQPGVQAYKLAAKGVLAQRKELFAALNAAKPVKGSACELAAKANLSDAADVVAGVLAKAAVNGEIGREFVNGQWIYEVK